MHIVWRSLPLQSLILGLRDGSGQGGILILKLVKEQVLQVIWYTQADVFYILPLLGRAVLGDLSGPTL